MHWVTVIRYTHNKITQDGRKEPLEIKLNKDQTSLGEISKAINDADSGISGYR